MQLANSLRLVVALALVTLLLPASASAERPRKGDVERQRNARGDDRSARRDDAPKRKSREELEEERRRRNDPFARGRTRLAVNGGMISDLRRNTVFALGIGFGHFVADGLELGFDSSVWLGSDPFVAQFSPGVRYVFPVRSPLRPYVGTFYRHWFIAGNFTDIDALGLRFGIFYAASPRAFMGIGAGWETVVSECDTDCSQWFPELTFSLSL